MIHIANYQNTKVLVAQLGARKHYQEPLLFHRWGVLDRLYTDFYSGHSAIVNFLRSPRIYRRLPNALKKGLDRYEAGLKDAKIIHFPKFGYQYVQSLKKATPSESSQIFVEGGREFCQYILKSGLGDANIIYGFNSACLELFKYAKTKGVRCILDQTLVDYSVVHQLLLAEEKRWQDWSIVPFSVSDADVKLMEREHHEQDLADGIICGSHFVKDSLTARGVETSKISVVPLGRLKDKDIQYPQLLSSTLPMRPDGLRILFIGSVCLRKGIPYLLAALKQIKGQIPFSCKIAGPIHIKPERINEYSDVCDFLGVVPRSQIHDLYTWADVFVLPSISEGSAIVTYEALSLGVPIITTYNSGSIVRDGIDGFIVPICDASAIAEKLVEIFASNQEKFVDTQTYLENILENSEKTLLNSLFKY